MLVKKASIWTSSSDFFALLTSCLSYPQSYPQVLGIRFFENSLDFIGKELTLRISF